jgi:hypothetical protein
MGQSFRFFQVEIKDINKKQKTFTSNLQKWLSLNY